MFYWVCSSLEDRSAEGERKKLREKEAYLAWSRKDLACRRRVRALDKGETGPNDVTALR
jgi:hypothetical protein